ncbi:DUF1206 domain-containing protein [Amycolatopsis keratiniphila]|uniref:DUF1206 domain-containing protein n=1 Tax=Amycolatopsis keratiniphila TaxID=129921 RepID=UPI00087C102E|nr:protein of unknown function [Amycolatopsis keratiniphila]
MRDSKVFGLIARGGLVCYAVVHLLVAWLAAQVALGDHARADKAGALQIVVAEGGAWLLWLIAAGLAVLAMWQLGEAITGHRHVKTRRRTVRRFVSGIEVVLYGLVSYSAVKIALAGADDGQSSLVAGILAESYGPALVAVAGVAVVAVAVFLAQRGLRKTFVRELDFGGAAGTARTLTIRLGQIGWIALSAAYGTIGVLTIIAGHLRPGQGEWPRRGAEDALRSALRRPDAPRTRGRHRRVRCLRATGRAFPQDLICPANRPVAP